MEKMRRSENTRTYKLEKDNMMAKANEDSRTLAKIIITKKNRLLFIEPFFIRSTENTNSFLT